MHTERQKDKQAKNYDGGCFSNFFCEYYTKVICYKRHIFGIGKHNQGKETWDWKGWNFTKTWLVGMGAKRVGFSERPRG